MWMITFFFLASGTIDERLFRLMEDDASVLLTEDTPTSERRWDSGLKIPRRRRQSQRRRGFWSKAAKTAAKAASKATKAVTNAAETPATSWNSAQGFCSPRRAHCKTTPTDDAACRDLTISITGAVAYAYKSQGRRCEVYFVNTVLSCPEVSGVSWYQSWNLGQTNGWVHPITGGDGNSNWMCHYPEAYTKTATACLREINGYDSWPMSWNQDVESAEECKARCTANTGCYGVSYSTAGDWSKTCFQAKKTDNPELRTPCNSWSTWDAYVKDTDSPAYQGFR